MTVLYAIRSLKYWLYSGIDYIILGLSFLLTKESSNFYWIWTGLGVLHLVVYFYPTSNGYTTIKKGLIRKNDFIFKSIKESEIVSVTYFAGEFVLKGNGK